MTMSIIYHHLIWLWLNLNLTDYLTIRLSISVCVCVMVTVLPPADSRRQATKLEGIKYQYKCCFAGRFPWRCSSVCITASLYHIISKKTAVPAVPAVPSSTGTGGCCRSGCGRRSLCLLPSYWGRQWMGQLMARIFSTWFYRIGFYEFSASYNS